MFNLSTIAATVSTSTGWAIVAGLALACIIVGAVIVRFVVDQVAE